MVNTETIRVTSGDFGRSERKGEIAGCGDAVRIGRMQQILFGRGDDGMGFLSRFGDAFRENADLLGHLRYGAARDGTEAVETKAQIIGAFAVGRDEVCNHFADTGSDFLGPVDENGVCGTSEIDSAGADTGCAFDLYG